MTQNEYNVRRDGIEIRTLQLQTGDSVRFQHIPFNTTYVVTKDGKMVFTLCHLGSNRREISFDAKHVSASPSGEAIYDGVSSAARDKGLISPEYTKRLD